MAYGRGVRRNGMRADSRRRNGGSGSLGPQDVSPGGGRLHSGKKSKRPTWASAVRRWGDRAGAPRRFLPRASRLWAGERSRDHPVHDREDASPDGRWQQGPRLDHCPEGGVGCLRVVNFVVNSRGNGFLHGKCSDSHRIANPPSSVRLRPEPLLLKPLRCADNSGLRRGFLLRWDQRMSSVNCRIVRVASVPHGLRYRLGLKA